MSRRNHEQIQQSSEEAEEVQEEIDPDPPSSHPASESEGEDLIEDASKDYHPIDVTFHQLRNWTIMRIKEWTHSSLI